MLQSFKTKIYPLFFLFTILFTSCNKDDDLQSAIKDENADNETIDVSPVVVFMAQSHVLRTNDEFFNLVSGKDALIKVNITTENKAGIANLTAVLSLNGAAETIPLNPPAGMLTPIDMRLGSIEHTFDNSYTAIISKEWILPGLEIVIEGNDTNIVLDGLKIGAPNKMIMNMFDLHFFELSPGDYPEGWKEELEAKLPVSEIALMRVPNIVFSELTVPARAGAPAARISSKEDYKTITGLNFDGEQLAASQWAGALRTAAGYSGRYALYYFNIYGVFAGGQAGGYSGVGSGTSLGILNHELGHALSLPHWGNKADYPYRDEMFGIPAPEVFNGVHVGPSWGFDMPTKTFIPPTVQSNAVGGVEGTYKKDPMQGGGSGDQEEGFLMRHFSNYSMNKMQNYLQNHIAVNNSGNGTYAKWDTATNSYSDVLSNNGVQYATTQNVEVISVMAGVSSVTPQATIVYPPIGPYNSGLISVFDPALEADRLMARDIYCPDNGCDVSLRITQGGQIKTRMLPIGLDGSADPLSSKSFYTKAVNLAASDGAVTKIELIATPDAEINGLPDNPELLYSWEN